MGWASGDQSQRVTSASSVWASRMSSWAGNFSQKSRRPKENPPLAPPTYPKPEARLPPPVPIQPCPFLVRLRSVNPSAESWERV
ncbi:hypothetical protein M2271_008101 [Streptomyces sp. LBL]|nr:hypothetical protein [Streptomyces sp. LBL]